MVGPAGGLPHRGARADEGPDGQERADRARRLQGRVRGQAAAGRRPRGARAGGGRLLPDVSRRAARPHRQHRRRAQVVAPAGWCATTATTRTWWSPPTRAPRRSPTSPTSCRPTTGSGSATRSPPAAPTATTTSGWASPPAAHGSRCAATSASSAPTSTPRTSRSSGSGTCPATCSATGCCSAATSAWWPRSTTGTCSSIPIPTPRARSPSGGGCSRCAPPAGRTTTARCSRPAAGVYERSAKRIPLSQPARAALGIEAAELTPAELIRELLKAPVDLLWNGGIGTYVKARAESHVDAGDKAGDALRVDGCELRCRVVGEGGNLGFTQRGRIEYAQPGRPDQHRRDRQRRRGELLRPRGEHQDPARRARGREPS